MSIYGDIIKNKAEGRKMLAVLVDPDKLSDDHLAKLSELFEQYAPTMILVGGSLVAADTEQAVLKLKRISSAPIVLFPGNSSQVAASADGILLLSLISGRNPEYLIGQHVNSAVQIKRSGMEVIPTGYMLIEGGAVTSVQYVSGTMPIPRLKNDIAVATAVAGELLGLKMLYLEAGSGASMPVPAEMVASVRQSVDLPIIVGGGLKSIDDVKKVFDSGADVVVVGTAIEKKPKFLQEVALFIRN